MSCWFYISEARWPLSIYLSSILELYVTWWIGGDTYWIMMSWWNNVTFSLFYYHPSSITITGQSSGSVLPPPSPPSICWPQCSPSGPEAGAWRTSSSCPRQASSALWWSQPAPAWCSWRSKIFGKNSCWSWELPQWLLKSGQTHVLGISLEKTSLKSPKIELSICSNAAEGSLEQQEKYTCQREVVGERLPGHVDGTCGGYEGGGDLFQGQTPEDADVGDVVTLLLAPVSCLLTDFSK